MEYSRVQEKKLPEKVYDISCEDELRTCNLLLDAYVNKMSSSKYNAEDIGSSYETYQLQRNRLSRVFF